MNSGTAKWEKKKELPNLIADEVNILKYVIAIIIVNIESD